MPARRPPTPRPRQSKSTLGRLFGSEARARILTALLLGAAGRYYVRNLAQRLHLPPTAVSRELLTLERLGLVRRRTEGRRLYCELDRDASVLPELRALVLHGDCSCRHREVRSIPRTAHRPSEGRRHPGGGAPERGP